MLYLKITNIQIILNKYEEDSVDIVCDVLKERLMIALLEGQEEVEQLYCNECC